MAFETTSGVTNITTERMRIDSSGTVDVKANSNNVNGMAAIIARLGSNCDNTTSYAFIAETGTANRCFIHGNGNIVNTNDSYGALSDERLKENIIDATPKLDDLMKVKVRNFNLIGEKTKQIGVVAQELEEVFPNMIDETKGLNPDDETLYKSVKYSVFVPMLIKAIQELEARVKELENK
jgi:UDP-glucose 4-epimerase